MRSKAIILGFTFVSSVCAFGEPVSIDPSEQGASAEEEVLLFEEESEYEEEECEEEFDIG